MTFKPISVSLLRKAAEEAKKRDQYGLLIWPSELKWRNFHRFVNSTSPLLPQIADTLRKEQMCWVGFAKGEVISCPKTGYVLAVPVSKILSSRDYCKKVLQKCPSGVGIPISTVPSMSLSSIHLTSGFGQS